ncbi:hypothetical protein LQ327_09265 [Actinomycetospora endophytica]|uniref:Uncharacterized protein n=1 Tax=Actinomycetospora endophytica TaxID=2291215 RepID=A0ABS8P838_9PSEU|nr:hypothetical protein [Actinomycetospora endophytica]MCD2193571.1 hypothetical protein [Actinomycetospora endophytica]
MEASGPRHSDPLAGTDGTAPPPPTADPAAGTTRPSDLRLPPLADADGVARWMDEDRERGLALWAPEVRDVPTPRPLPPPRRRRTLPPETSDETTAVSGGPPEDEPAWRRERREEAEFRAEFGEWRPGRAAAPTAGRSGGFLGGVRLGAPLLVLIAVLIAVAALALHL